MDPLQEGRLERLFEEAMALPPAQRASFLTDRCANDRKLRVQLEALLAQAAQAHDFMDRVAGRAVAQVARAVVGDSDDGPEDAADTLAGDQINHFRIVGKLGDGGMGRVYKALDLTLDRTVALKFLPSHLSGNEDAKRRLVREAKAASALDHPNICAIHEIGETDEKRLFISMAYYDGETLKTKIARGPLPVGEALAYGARIAAGLRRAHGAGFVHRDIKPANVIVTAHGEVKVLDFGLATTAGRDLTREAVTIGTVAYMSPEQTRGEAVDQRSDVWSLGVVLYEMLTGQKPFRGDSERSVIHAIRHDPPPPVDRPGYPAGVATFVSACLEKDAALRPQAAEDVLSHLERLAAPRSASAPTWHRWRTKRVALYVGAAAVLLAVAGYPLVARQLRRQAAAVQSAPTFIAVLPFANVSPDRENEYFADGMTEELITALTRIEGLHVTARTSSFAFKGKEWDVRDVARRLGVGSVIAGSVRLAGDRLRVTAQLIDARTGTSLWSETYERPMNDVFAVQDDITRAIVAALDLRLKSGASGALTRRATPNVEAYDLYLRGRFAWNQRTPRALAQAGQYFAEAAVKDSAFALAYVGHADVYSQLPQYSHREWRTLRQPAWAAARKAVSLDSTLAEAHATLGLLSSFDYDWQNAERELRQALALNPGYATAHHWFGIVLRSQGRLAEALDALERARELDPVSRVIRSAQAGTFYLRHDYDGAITRLRAVLDLDPDFAEAHRLLARSFGQKGTYDSALVHLDRAAEIARTVEGGDIGFTLARAGRQAEAERVLADLLTRATREYIRPGHVALVHIGLGNRDSALVWLARAVDKGDPTIVNLKTDPRFDTLRGDARFALLLRQMRLQG